LAFREELARKAPASPCGLARENISTAMILSKRTTEPKSVIDCMTNAKIVRTRSRRPGQERVSKTRSDNRQNIPPELRALISPEIERQLQLLVALFGEKQVLEKFPPRFPEKQR
jgi:hypothetical protein